MEQMALQELGYVFLEVVNQLKLLKLNNNLILITGATCHTYRYMLVITF